MAREGRFSKSGVQYGVSLSFVHPPDNQIPSQFDPALNDPLLALTDAQKADLQARIDDLYSALRGQSLFL